MESIAVTGSGMLASALLQLAPEYGFTGHAITRALADITDRQAVLAAVCAVNPLIVFHTAAETRVDYCERHGEEALQVNALGTTNVGLAAVECDAKLVYLSTDYVFNGDKTSPWLESDEPHPLNAYGVSKLAGEWAVQTYQLGYIIRTSGVFGARGDGKEERNFFKAIAAKLAASSESIDVVDDQVTAISYAPHLAHLLLRLASQGLPRIAHLTSAGEASWYGWARRAATILQHDPERIRPATTSEAGGKARRPRYSVLGSEHPEVAEMIRSFPAEEGLREYLARFQ